MDEQIKKLFNFFNDIHNEKFDCSVTQQKIFKISSLTN